MLFRGLAGFLLLTPALLADATMDDAMSLLHSKRLPEARDALEKLVAVQPKNATAWHELGMVWRKSDAPSSFEKAVNCLEKAAELESDNATFLADYGGTAMEYAGRSRSISSATKGRDAMEKAVALNPELVDAREGLYQFYIQAPFFVGGSSKKAAIQLEEIRRRDPDRATVLEVITKTNAKQYAEAFALCDAVLARNSNNYTALYQYGRTASVSGQNLQRGLACLQRVLALTPPSPASPKYTHAWFRIGDVQQKLGHTAEARKAYEKSLELDPANRQASAALGKLP